VIPTVTSEEIYVYMPVEQYENVFLVGIHPSMAFRITHVFDTVLNNSLETRDGRSGPGPAHVY
jgi:hypothetical protein